MKFETIIHIGNQQVKRYVTFTGEREGYFEDEAGNKTCSFWFDTFANVCFKSYKDGQEYQTGGLPLGHPMQKAATGVRSAYMDRRKLQWEQEEKIA